MSVHNFRKSLKYYKRNAHLEWSIITEKKKKSYFSSSITDQNSTEMDVMVLFPLLPSQDLAQSIRQTSETGW